MVLRVVGIFWFGVSFMQGVGRDKLGQAGTSRDRLGQRSYDEYTNHAMLIRSHLMQVQMGVV